MKRKSKHGELKLLFELLPIPKFYAPEEQLWHALAELSADF